MELFIDFFVTALYSIFIQNFVLSGGLGMSEVLRAATKPRRFVMFIVMLSGFSVLTSVICRALDYIPAIDRLSPLLHFILFALVLIFLFLIVTSLLLITIRPTHKFISTLGMAALNTMVLAIPLINRQMGYSMMNSIGSGLGAGLAFALAAVLISKGLSKIADNEDIPAAFRGTPAMLLYVSLLSMMFLGLSGNGLFG